MSQYVVDEVDGEFVIPIEGFVCTYVQNDQDLILCDPDSTEEAWLSGSCLEFETMVRLAKHRARVESAVAGSDSTLRVGFDDGFSLVNPPAREFEAWELRGPGHMLLVGVPGGGPPAVWDATPDIRLIRFGDPLPTQVATMIELYETLPTPGGDFQFRLTSHGSEAIELHAPDAPQMNRNEIIRFVLPRGLADGELDAYMRYTN